MRTKRPRSDGRRRAPPPLLGLAGTVALLACGGVHDASVDEAALGVPQPARRTANAIYLGAATATGAGGELLVDTGAPVTVLAPGRFAVAAGAGTVDRLTLGALAVGHAPALGLALFPDEPGLPTGLLGGSLLCQFAVTLDYRAATVTLARAGAAATGDGTTEAQRAVPFRLQGGGTGVAAGARFDYPATRVPVEALVEGARRSLLVDTGASYVVLRDALWRQLAADGRPRLDGVPIESASGQVGASLLRARTIAILDGSGAAIDAGQGDVPTLDVGDALLDELAAEVGHPVDGLLGGAFLRGYRVTVDYPAGALRLARYATGADPDATDEFHQIGVALDFADRLGDRSGHRFVVEHVFAGTDAARAGLAVGTPLVAVDGQPLDGLRIDEADALLRGPVGAVRRLTTATGDVAVSIDDLLPP